MEKRPQINFSHLVENIYLKLCPVMSSNVHPYIHVYCNCPEVKKYNSVCIYIVNRTFLIFRLWLAGSFIGTEQTGTRKSSTNSSSNYQKSKSSVIPRKYSYTSTSDYR